MKKKELNAELTIGDDIDSVEKYGMIIWLDKNKKIAEGMMDEIVKILTDKGF